MSTVLLVPSETWRGNFFDHDGAPPRFGLQIKVELESDLRKSLKWSSRASTLIAKDLTPFYFLWRLINETTYRTDIRNAVSWFIGTAAVCKKHPEIIHQAVNCCSE